MEDIKKYISIMENFYNVSPFGGVQQSEDSENISYSKTKKEGDASVTVSANAKSMDELHRILKLAGIEMDSGGEHDVDDNGVCDSCGKPNDECDCEGHDHGEEPCPDCGEVDCQCDSGCDHDHEEEPKNMVTITGYNPVGGDKKEILNALMKKYQSI
jgi:hypothetical protein